MPVLKIKDEVLLQFIKSYPDAYLREISAHFGVNAQAVFMFVNDKKILLKREERNKSKRADF
ncbi:IS630 transposase-related protein [Candidatus Protochlamydia amoebophila]|uniref:Transposase Synechocystis PCC 6803 domain-containing protein n=1 Tax=Candidatus Protochlamydia amoebophila TaxID=362787 RepID=A0A0C1JKK8_9BACT|nr:hypothetical protein DB44_CW00030 [Candidatus Protochlamydia amoebophila]